MRLLGLAVLQVGHVFYGAPLARFPVYENFPGVLCDMSVVLFWGDMRDTAFSTDTKLSYSRETMSPHEQLAKDSTPQSVSW